MTVESAKQIASSLVLSHLDYSNGVLVGLPEVSIQRMQRIQNWAAKVVLCHNKYESSSFALYLLHWLPIKHRIHFKVISLVYKCIHRSAPKYLSNLINIRQFTRSTRSAISSKQAVVLEVPHVHWGTFACRSFSVAGPNLWNALPESIRRIGDYLVFRNHLKSHLFKDAFNKFI